MTVVVEAMVNTITPQVLMHALTIQHRLVREITQLLNIAAQYAASFRAGKRGGNGGVGGGGGRGSNPGSPNTGRSDGSSGGGGGGGESFLPPVLTPMMTPGGVSQDGSSSGRGGKSGGGGAAPLPEQGTPAMMMNESSIMDLSARQQLLSKPRYYCSLDFIMEGIQLNGAYAPDYTKTRKKNQPSLPYLSLNTGAFRLQVQRAPPIPPALPPAGVVWNGNRSGGRTFFAPTPPKGGGGSGTGGGAAGSEAGEGGGAGGGGGVVGEGVAQSLGLDLTGQPALLRWDVHLQGLRLVLNQVTGNRSNNNPHFNRRWSLDRSAGGGGGGGGSGGGDGVAKDKESIRAVGHHDGLLGAMNATKGVITGAKAGAKAGASNKTGKPTKSVSMHGMHGIDLNNDMLNSDLVHIVTNISIRNNPMSQMQRQRNQARAAQKAAAAAAAATAEDRSPKTKEVDGGQSYYGIVIDHTGIILQPGAMSMATKMYGRYSRNFKRYQLTRRKMKRHAKEDHRKLEEATLNIGEQLRATGKSTLSAYESSLLRMRHTKTALGVVVEHTSLCLTDRDPTQFHKSQEVGAAFATLRSIDLFGRMDNLVRLYFDARGGAGNAKGGAAGAGGEAREGGGGAMGNRNDEPRSSSSSEGGGGRGRGGSWRRGKPSSSSSSSSISMRAKLQVRRERTTLWCTCSYSISGV